MRLGGREAGREAGMEVGRQRGKQRGKPACGQASRAVCWKAGSKVGS